MATVPYAITTTERVKAQLSLKDVDVARDTYLDSLVAAVTDSIENYCGGRRFAATDYVEVYDTYVSNKIFLRQRPVNTVTSVEYRAGLPASPTWVTYNANSYLTYLKAGFINFFSKFVAFPQAFRVTYNAGYLIDWAHEYDATKHTLPHDLTTVATELVARKYNQRFSSGIYTESTEGQSITYESDKYALQDDHKAVLNGYKLIRVAP